MSAEYLTYDNLDDQLQGAIDQSLLQEQQDTTQQQEASIEASIIQDQPIQLITEKSQEDDDEEKHLSEEEIELRNLVRRLGLREKEIHDTFIINENKIKDLMSDKEKSKLQAVDLVVFKDKADDIIGIELDSYIQFLINKKTKHTFTFKEIKKAFLYWLEWSYKERNKDPVIEEQERQAEIQQQQEQQTLKMQQQEKFLWRKKMSIDITQFKISKHKDKIREVFSRYQKLNDPNNQSNKPSIKIKQVKTIFADISYLAGLVFCYWKEFEATNQYAGYKDSSIRFIKSFKRYLWKFLHDQQIIEDHVIQKYQKRKTYKGQSPEGYFELRSETPQKVFFEDDKYKMDKGQTEFEFSLFKRALKQFVQDKKIVAVDFNNEYIKFLKKREKEQSHKDLRQHLSKTIGEYEQLAQQTDDEQQRQRLEKLIEQMKRELQNLNSETNNVSNFNMFVNDSFTLENFTRNGQSVLSLEQSFLSQNNTAIQSSPNNNVQDELENVSNAKREKALRQIFNFYSKQHIAYNQVAFDQIKNIGEELVLGDFLKFCKDFSLNKDQGLNKQKLTSIFHKSGQCHKPLIYNEFLRALELLGQEINQIAIDKKEKQLNDIKKQLQDLISEVKHREEEHAKYMTLKDSQRDQFKRFTEEEKKEFKRKEKDLKSQQDVTDKEIQRLKAKTKEVTTDELYRYMELDDQKLYMPKIKGFHLPFYMHEKLTRIPDDDIGHNYKIRNKKVPFSDVKKIVQEIRDKREKDKHEKMMVANEKYIRKMKYIQQTHDRLRQEKLKKIIEERKQLQSEQNPSQVNNGRKSNTSVSPNYAKPTQGYLAQLNNPFGYLDIKNKKQGNEQINDISRNLKVTLDILTKMNYQDFNNAGDKKQVFNPLDLIQSKANPLSEDDEIAFTTELSHDEDIELDEFTKKRLPKVEDFIDNSNHKKAKKDKRRPSKLINDFQEKILSLKNSTAVPQNHLILDQGYEVKQKKQGNYGMKVSKSMAQLPQGDILPVRNKLQGNYDSIIVKNQHQQYPIQNQKGGSLIARYESNIPKSLSKGPNQVSAQQLQQLMKNASQNVMIKASQLDLKNKDVRF